MSHEHEDAALEQGGPLAGALRADGARWRAEQSANASVIERRLRASLQVGSDAPEGLRVMSLAESDAEYEEWDAKGARAILPQEPETRVSQKRRVLTRVGTARRSSTWVSVVVAAVVLIGLVGSLYALRDESLLPGGLWNPFHPAPWVSMPPPQFMSMSGPISAGATPQQAFAEGIELRRACAILARLPCVARRRRLLP